MGNFIAKPNNWTGFPLPLPKEPQSLASCEVSIQQKVRSEFLRKDKILSEGVAVSHILQAGFKEYVCRKLEAEGLFKICKFLILKSNAPFLGGTFVLRLGLMDFLVLEL